MWFRRILFILLGLILLFAFYTMNSTGFFRNIEEVNQYQIHQKIALWGAEDITISRSDSFAIISSTKRNTFPAEEQERGDLYFMDLKNEPFKVQKLTGDITRSFAPHGISIFQTSDSTYKVAAINHTEEGHSIEIFQLKNEQLTFVKTIRDASLISPNDLVLVNENQFYFTNDHRSTEGFGKFQEEYLGFRKTNVVYFDGTDFKEVADGIAYANGINMDTKHNLLYVASVRDFLVKVYQILDKGDLKFIADIDCDTGVDNIEMDNEGNLWIGAHPSLLHFNFYNKNFKEKAPSEIIKVNFESAQKHSIEKIYVEDGSTMSGASVATPFGNYLLAGNVKDSIFLVLKK